MRSLITISLLILLTLSCSTSTGPDQPEYTWEKIDIENESTIYSFWGNFDDYLLIGTNGSILKSNNSGASWEQVYSVTYNVREFRQQNDTLFALASHEDYFSLNNGESWDKASSKKTYNLNNSDTASNGIIYKLDPQFEGESAKPTLVLKSEDGENWEEIFPYSHYIYSIYIDDEDRLYLGINGWEWDEERGSFDPNSGNKAIIYYTK